MAQGQTKKPDGAIWKFIGMLMTSCPGHVHLALMCWCATHMLLVIGVSAVLQYPSACNADAGRTEGLTQKHECCLVK